MKIHKLPQELINQIAAGEVIERPSSVVKELLDNSLDANATYVKIKIEKGGLDLIEISDNGLGISQEMLETAFQPHTTSKLMSLDDLNSLLTRGFRGEALSTIVSVAQVKAVSRTEESDDAYKIEFEGIESKGIQPAARDIGTTISVENLFASIPARLKFMKSEATEYRKILEIVTPYFLNHPNVHFILEKNGKEVFNLPAINDEKNISESRIKEVLKGDFTDELIEIYSDGAGVKIQGYIAHPKYHGKNIKHQYLFVNNRAVKDSGVYRSVLTGYGRLIPHGEKVPYVVSIQIDSSQVDVNVHPRKEEVRFLNPYRTYTMIERAVSDALEKVVNEGYVSEAESLGSTTEERGDIAYNRLRSSQEDNISNSGSVREISFDKPAKSQGIQESMQFSEQVLRDSLDQSYVQSDSATQDELMSDTPFNNIVQMFNKYIVLQKGEEMWMIDQHAAAERITFERLEQNYDEGSKDVQNMLVPDLIKLSADEIAYLEENIKFFNKIGFQFDIKEDGILVTAVPVEFVGANINEVFTSIFEMSDDQRDIEKNFETAKGDVLATVACHNSIRTNQKLQTQELISQVQQLLDCKLPYSCPHGRPIVWKQKLSEIDKNFDRTY